MGRSKKHAKGRLDRYYHLAKESGYRARSAFKLIQLNKKYGFLQNARVLIDLCAAPGGWLQVAEKYMPAATPDGRGGSVILGVDLEKIKPVPRCRTAVEDITKESCRKWIRGELKDWKADVVLHDGAPNVGTSWTSDAYQQSLLVLSALSLAVAFLAPGGTFVTKVFRSRDYNSLLWVFHQLFDRVDATKPASSRNVSAEIFVVCRGYKAPSRVDPRLLDFRHVFKELDDDEDATQEAKDAEKRTINSLVKPEAKTRHRDGYATGDYTLRKVGTVREFLASKDPVGVLASSTELVFGAAEEAERKKAESRARGKPAAAPEAEGDDEDGEGAAPIPERMVGKPAAIPDDVDLSEHVPAEVAALLSDLRVLGKAEFRQLLRWREQVRKRLGLEPSKAKSAKAEDEQDAEEDPEDALAGQIAEQQRLAKQERRRRLERRKRELMRFNLGMSAHDDIAQDAEEGLGFDWGRDAGDEDGKEGGDEVADADGKDDGEEGDEEVLDDEEEEQARLRELEEEMDTMYDVYLERQLSKDAKARARKRLEEEKKGRDPAAEPWFGVEEELRRIEEKKAEEGLGSDSDSDSESDEDEADGEGEEDGEEGEGSGSEAGEDADEEAGPDSRREDTADARLSRRARQFFDNPLFKDVLGDLEASRAAEATAAPAGKRAREAEAEAPKKRRKGKDTEVVGAADPEEDSDEEFIRAARKNRKELRRARKAGEATEEGDEGGKQTFETVPAEPDPVFDGESGDEDALATAEGVTAALALVKGGAKARRDLVDGSFNRYAFNDPKGSLPRWFADDEGKHNKPQAPISKEAVLLIRERARQLDARPIKKIAEAKGRKKMRAMRRLQKLNAEIGKIWDDEDPGTTEMQKLRTIQKVAAKAAKGKGGQSKKEKPKLVVAKGTAKGVQGRPKGVKGRYKMVDARMKKELRAQKRKAKASKPKRRK